MKIQEAKENIIKNWRANYTTDHMDNHDKEVFLLNAMEQLEQVVKDNCALDKCPQSTAILGNTHSAVNSVPVFDTMPKAPTRPPLPIKYCGICARILTQTPIGTYYNHDTAELYNHWKFTCPEYRWWKIWDRYHTNFRCDEDGNTYSYEA